MLCYDKVTGPTVTFSLLGSVEETIGTVSSNPIGFSSTPFEVSRTEGV